MKHLLRPLLWPLCALWLAACAGAPPLPADAGAAREHTVYVVGDGWHTALVLPRRALLAQGPMPEARDFPDAAFLEVGWGDRAYYPARQKTLGLLLDAAFVPTPAVMHVRGHATAPRPDADARRAVALRLTDAGLRRLVRTVAADIQRPEGGRADPVGRGLFPDSRFYPAHGRFHLFNTCNTWVARMLRTAGIAVRPAGVITGDDLWRQLRATEDEIGGTAPAPIGERRSAG